MAVNEVADETAAAAALENTLGIKTRLYPDIKPHIRQLRRTWQVDWSEKQATNCM